MLGSPAAPDNDLGPILSAAVGGLAACGNGVSGSHLLDPERLENVPDVGMLVEA